MQLNAVSRTQKHHVIKSKHEQLQNISMNRMRKIHFCCEYQNWLLNRITWANTNSNNLFLLSIIDFSFKHKRMKICKSQCKIYFVESYYQDFLYTKVAIKELVFAIINTTGIKKLHYNWTMISFLSIHSCKWQTKHKI